MNIIYLDNSATTRVEEETLQVMNQYHSTWFGNPSSLHGMGLTAEKAVDGCRSAMGQILSVKPEEIVFTSGGTESNNLAILGGIEKQKRRGRKLITSKTEHPSVLEAFRHAEREGMDVVYLDVDAEGRVRLDQLEENLDEDTMLVSIMHVNNETGVIQDLESIGKAIKNANKNTIFHCDCIQSFGKIPVKPRQWQADMVSLSAHKMHGPKGLGALYVKKNLGIHPIFHGGGQEGGLRSGTENVAGIAGWHQVLKNLDMEAHQGQVRGLKTAFLDTLEKSVADIQINSPLGDGFVHHIASVSFADLRGEVLLHALERKGVYVSTGSACSSKKRGQSHVLEQLPLEKTYMEGTIRFSFSRLNTLEEIQTAIKQIVQEVEGLRKFARRR